MDHEGFGGSNVAPGDILRRMTCAATAEYWDLYDCHGNPLSRTIRRGEVLANGEYHWVVQIWVRNSSGAFLIQKRSDLLDNAPGLWGPTAGSVQADENVRNAAVRELFEEVGLHVAPQSLRHVFQKLRSDSIATAWLIEMDVDLNALRLQESEVTAVRWAEQSEIRNMISDGLFLNYGDDYFDVLFRS